MRRRGRAHAELRVPDLVVWDDELVAAWIRYDGVVMLASTELDF